MPQERIRALSPAKRVRTFQEVRLGLSRGEAVENARIFLDRERSVKGAGCPLETRYFDVLRFVAKGDFSAAYDTLLQTNPLPGITGRLAEEPYEATQAYNRRGECVSLRGIERFLDDVVSPSKTGVVPARSRHRIAVVGSGVSGLSAAAWLVRLGYSVVVLDSSHVPGGKMLYGYGEFTLPERVVQRAVLRLQTQGVEFRLNTLVGRAPFLNELADERGFSAVLLATGAGGRKSLMLAGDSAAGIFPVDQAMKLWRWMKGGQASYMTPPFLGPQVLVLGDGAIAFEAARTALRLGKEATVLVPGAESEIKAPVRFVQEALEEGVRIKTFVRPLRLESDAAGCVKGVVFRQAMDYRVDSEGRLNVVEDRDSETFLEGQTIINASDADPETMFFRSTPELELDETGCIVVQDGGASTSMRKVFAAGCVTDPRFSLLEDMLSARRAAGEIDRFFRS